jgi:type IV pilus assembly protein PilF
MDPNNVDALQQLAAVMYERGDYLNARAFIERRVSAGTANPEMLDLAARIEDKLGDRDGADGYRRRLRSEFPQYNSSQP